MPRSGEQAAAYALRAARAKARAVLDQIPSPIDPLLPGPEQGALRLVEPDLAGAVIIAADTVVLLDGHIYGKPKDKAMALTMLRTLAGQTHSVITGCALLHLPARLSKSLGNAAALSPPEAMEAATFAVKSRVTLWQAPDELLQAYAANGEALDKAGAYAVQGMGAFLVQAIEGSWTNVVGLPMAELLHHMLHLGALRPAPPAS